MRASDADYMFLQLYPVGLLRHQDGTRYAVTSRWRRLIHSASIITSVPIDSTFILFTFHAENQGTPLQ